MKKYLIIFFLVFTASKSFSQIFTFGAKSSLQVMTTAYHDSEIKDLYKTGFNFGYNAGGFIEFPLPDHFSILAECTYSVKGRKYTYNDEFKNNATYTYIDFPLLVKKSFPLHSEGFTSYWFINIGPDISYWSGGHGTLGNRDYDLVFSEVGTVIQFQKMHLYDVNRFMFGLDFGIGYTAYIMQNQRFFVEGRFTYGHTYFGSEDSAYINILGFEDDLRSNFRILNLSFGYGLTIDLHDRKKGASTMDRVRKKKKR